MDTEASVAIFVASLALLGTIITFVVTARRNDLDILRGIIEEMQKKIDDLEWEVQDYQDWAARLVCQVEGAGLEAVKFIRRKREPTKPKQE